MPVRSTPSRLVRVPVRELHPAFYAEQERARKEREAAEELVERRRRQAEVDARNAEVEAEYRKRMERMAQQG